MYLSYITAIERFGTNKTLFQKKGTKGKNKAEWMPAPENIHLENGQVIPRGAQIKCFESRDFGYLVIGPNETDSQGREFLKRIWRY